MMFRVGESYEPGEGARLGPGARVRSSVNDLCGREAGTLHVQFLRREARALELLRRVVRRSQGSHWVARRLELDRGVVGLLQVGRAESTPVQILKRVPAGHQLLGGEASQAQLLGREAAQAQVDDCAVGRAQLLNRRVLPLVQFLDGEPGGGQLRATRENEAAGRSITSDWRRQRTCCCGGGTLSPSCSRSHRWL